MSYSSPITILLIDDCLEDREIVRRFLQRDKLYTYRIVELETGIEAIEWCQRETPDIILLDYMLPDGDGIEFLEEFRQYFSISQTSVIMLTGQGDEVIAVRSMKSGAQDYLVKGQITAKILQSTIHQLFTQLQLNRQLEQIREQQQLIASAALRIHQSLQLEEILSTIATEVRQFLKADRVLVYQFHPDMSGTIVAESVLPIWKVSFGMQIEDTCFQQGGGRQYYQGRKRSIDDVYQAGLTDCHLQLLEEFAVKANLVVPIMVTEQLWGLLIAHQCSAPRHWKPHELDLLDQLSIQIAIAIQKASAYEQAQAELAERKQAEMALQESEARFQAFMNHSPSASWITDTDARLVYVSQTYLQVVELGAQTVDDVIGKTAYDLYPVEIAQQFVENTRLVAQTQRVLETIEKAPRRDGTIGDFLVYKFPLPNISGQCLVGGVAVDITERVRAEQALQQLNQELETRVEQRTAALQESEERWQLVLRGSNDGIWDWDFRKNEIFVSTRWKEMRGLEGEEISNKVEEWSSRVHPEDYGRVIQAIYDHFDHKTPFFQEEYRIKHTDGSYRWILDRGQALWDETGNVIRMSGSQTDITQRKKDEAELLAISTLQKAILDGSDYSIIFTDSEGVIQIFNAGAEKMLGYTADEVIGKHDPKLFHKAEEIQPLIAKLSLELGREIPGGKEFFTYMTQNGQIYENEFTYIRKDGSSCPVFLSLSALSNSQGQIIGLLGIAKDITDRKRNEEELRHLSARLSLALQAGAIGTWDWDLVKDPEWDERMYQLYGLQRSEISSTYEAWRKAVAPEDLAEFDADFQQMMEEKKEFRREFRVIHPDGSVHFLISALVVQHNEQGKPKRMVGINYDITERKRIELALRKSEQRYAALTQAAPVAIFQINSVGECIYANDRWGEITGRPAIAALGKGWIDTLHPEDRDRIVAKWSQWYQNYEPGQIYRLEGRCLRPDDSITWFYCQILAETDGEGNIVGYIGTLTDITEQKQAETQLWQTNEELTKANTELARATRLKDEFLANMSHELRTPLNAILGMSEGLQDHVFGAVSDVQLKAIATIERSGRHLLELINDILDLSKIESGKLELELSDVSVKSLCDSSLIFIKQMALKKKISLKSNIASNFGTIQVDERRMRQVLINLLNNAVKFTPEHGCVSLKVWLEAPVSPHSPTSTSSPVLCFSVIDTGIGISQQDMGKLFQSFVQVNSSLNRQYEGTGLGLALVKRIVELHHGTITVSSEIDRGSCFTVRIPYLTNHEKLPTLVHLPSSVEQELSPPTVKSHVILLVEDNQVNIYTTLDYLESRGYRLIVANNGKQALEILKTEQPDLILMDIQMPEMDGIEAIHRIRQDLQVDVPIIALTALAMPGDKDNCLAAGANEYFTKPIQFKQLVATIEKLLKR
ncbi:two-component hybrid sensor and regulator [Richelia sinica FACHB-800]|uniref:Circadian input-output histidine kinase CikA n=1 Tax=Richelia sinica FACHB-800 TaxID=1357546 RepID=A0A975Y2S5_9NOST|nr:PAS domain S-box protein [Richelia sinica]MBD2665330.1 PAS domain S-box protein [Richelia sinica FACHB-800]QXE21390.1 two-component hybrid sensor and regulator [Richelia sinica FACHB-800]